VGQNREVAGVIGRLRKIRLDSSWRRPAELVRAHTFGTKQALGSSRMPDPSRVVDNPGGIGLRVTTYFAARRAGDAVGPRRFHSSTNMVLDCLFTGLEPRPIQTAKSPSSGAFPPTTSEDDHSRTPGCARRRSTSQAHAARTLVAADHYGDALAAIADFPSSALGARPLTVWLKGRGQRLARFACPGSL
jgi:hypothetical protein